MKELLVNINDIKEHINCVTICKFEKDAVHRQHDVRDRVFEKACTLIPQCT